MAAAELLVGGWFLSPVIKSVIDKGEKYLVANHELQKDTKKLVETLKENLVMMRATVKQAEELMTKVPDLATWLKILEKAAYDAEDVLDNMEAKSIKEQVQGKNKVRNLTSALNVFISDDNHNSLKKEIDKLKEVSDNIKNFLPRVNMESNNNEFSDLAETIYGPLEEVEFYVRKEELNLILEIMLDPKSEFSSLDMEGTPGFSWCWRGRKNCNYHGLLVQPIIGVGGVGKTELAKAVYNNPEVQQSFEAKAWISVSSNLNVELIMYKLINSLRGYLCLDGMTLQYSSVNLSSMIEGVRFFVVLDDVCEKIENKWDDLFTTLSQGAPGSVVVITTQNQAFANRVGTFGHIELRPLVWKIFWELFKHFVFGNTEIPHKKRSLLEKIGTEIAGKLHRLPLAAKIIGNILNRNIGDLDEWMRIARSEWWDMPEDDERSKILPFIGVSYQHLGPNLRKCFAYCSLFPRNLVIDKDRLVQMWIAQNFIPDDVNGDGEMEDVGRKWFDKLVALSIFQPSGDNKGFVMPSHMHDLAVIVSSSECFFLRDRSQQIPDSVRHLAVDPEDVEVVEKIRKHKKLRSFLYFGSQVDGIDIAINNILRELDRIRVLDLSYLHTSKKKPPSAIQNMPHLRFLNLSSTGIKKLTHSRFDHYHLQSLHIVGCPLIKLPWELNNLINLRHLNGDAETIALISGIGKLTNLQELHEYRVGKTEGNKITELKNLRGLTGHLRIVNCENIRSKEEAEQARLVDKNNLQSVEISWSSAQREADIDMEILEGLQPYEGTSELTVNGYMGISFPDWMRGASHFLNLQTIRLISCINIEFLPFDLWQPPRLSTLEIVDNLSLREAPLHYFSASLKALKIIGCHNLNSLAESLPHLTSLALLHVINCQLSISVNINGLTMLEELMLTDCPKLSIQGDLQSLINLKRVDISDVPFTQTFGSSINKPQRSISTPVKESIFNNMEGRGGLLQPIQYPLDELKKATHDFSDANKLVLTGSSSRVEESSNHLESQPTEDEATRTQLDLRGHIDEHADSIPTESSTSNDFMEQTMQTKQYSLLDIMIATNKFSIRLRYSIECYKVILILIH
ncbi:Disease resistance protein RPP13 [Rhynchospora pubera]|uniref:Disease resistance protein RPP13 n=1 Tax=Rhynchospora pubera TaxID=906938 RepID=A0AAV8DHW8_9POAL|nr:Disease resistance protein RPP13 [Rhynchospora pubera]